MRKMSPIIASALAGFLAGALAPPVAAHEFTVAIVGDGLAADTVAHVAEVVRGFIVAADENDGHSDETSDGHLGGLDVQIWVLPPNGAAEVGELVGTPKDLADIALLLGPVPSAMGIGDAALGLRTIRVRPGALPPVAAREANGFARRFTSHFGRAPSEAAAQGYNAARRLDQTIRSFGSLEQHRAIEAKLVESEEGIGW